MAEAKRIGGLKPDEPATLATLSKKPASAFTFSAKKPAAKSGKKQCSICEKPAMMACRLCKQNVCMGHRDPANHTCKDTMQEMKDLAKEAKKAKPEEDK